MDDTDLFCSVDQDMGEGIILPVLADQEKDAFPEITAVDPIPDIDIDIAAYTFFQDRIGIVYTFRRG